MGWKDVVADCGLRSSQRAKERVGELGKNADWKSRSSKKPYRIPRRNLKYRPLHFRRCQYQRQFSRRVYSHITIVRHHPRSGNLKVQTGEEKFNHTKARVSRWAHGNQSYGQIEGSPERIPYRERLRLARQQCSPTLDQRGWKLQAVCEKSSSEDPGQELHPLTTRWDDGQPC